MSDRQPYGDEDVIRSLGDFDSEVDQDDEGYDPRSALEATRERSLWYPEADDTIRMRTRGYYPDRYPKGAIVHFTAGRSERDARDTETTIQATKDKYCFFCISKSGKVYQTAPLDHWGSHAGESSYAGLGDWVSNKLVGIEICNAGLLTKTDEGYEPYWNENYSVGDSRRTIYTEEQVRFADRGENVRDRGFYHAYTVEQEANLVKLLLWLKAQKPDVFQWQFVLGHDEVAPHRKNDPGGALSRTMPEFRAWLEELEAAGLTEMPGPPPLPVEKPTPAVVVAPVPSQAEPQPIPQSEPVPGPVAQPDPILQPEPVPQPEPVLQPDPQLASGAQSGVMETPVPAAPVPSGPPVVQDAGPFPVPGTPVAAPAEHRERRDENALRIGPDFVRLLNAYRAAEIEFPHLKDITFAQWSLESGYGTSELAVWHKNFAGMKWRRDMSLYAREVFYRPAHDPKDSAYCGFSTLENFIKGYWHRLDIPSLPYASTNGGWRRHAATADEFIGFIGPIWAPSGGDNSLLNNGYIRKIKTVLAQLEQAGLLPSQEPVTRVSNERVTGTPSHEAMRTLARRYEQAAETRGGLTEAEAGQVWLLHVIEDCAARGDHDGMNSALGKLNVLLDRQDAVLGSQEIRRLVATLVSQHSIRRNSNAQANVYELIDRIEACSIPVPPKMIEINQAADQLYAELAGLPPPLGDWAVEQLVMALRRAGAYEWLAKIADRLIAVGNRQMIVRRFYAQALVELGQINAAISMLELMVMDEGLPKADVCEIHGQLGRAYSQIYVNHVRSPGDAYGSGEAFGGYLRLAIKHYRAGYDVERLGASYWQGIRLAALLKLAEQDGVQVSGFGRAEDIAREILQTVQPKVHQQSDPWEIATVAESYLVLGDYQSAESWYKGFAGLGTLQHFHLAGTIRVLEDVWRLAHSNDAKRASLMALKAARTRERTTQISLSPEERVQIRSPSFQTAYPDSDFLKYAVLCEIVKAGESVAWIKDRHLAGVGSGFLIQGFDLAPSLGNDLYLLTNTHVICDPLLARDNRDNRALTPSEARIQFEASRVAGSGKIYMLEPKAVWQSPSSACDACLLRLKDIPSGVSPARIASIEHPLTAGDLEDASDGTPVAVLGHAKGDVMQLGVRGNLVNHQGSIVDIGPRMPMEKQPVFLHYDSPTLPGNSGSPVFDTTIWQVIGLHHAGFDASEGRPRLYGRGGFHNANEGIYIHSIGRAIENELKTKKSFHLIDRLPIFKAKAKT